MEIQLFKKHQYPTAIPDGNANDERTSLGFSPFRFFLLFILFLVLAYAGSEFWEQFYNDPTLDPEEVAAAQREAEEIANRHETWIQYALIATTTMQRPCLRCPNGIHIVTVRTGEVYKYGITTQGQARYEQQLYENLQVRMVEQVVGEYTLCKTAEVNKIVAYRFLPESQKPEVKLNRPPGNAYRN